MKAFLLLVVKSRAFKLCLGALAAAAAAYAGTGCSALLGAARAPRVERFGCEVAALEPIFGQILDSEELLRSLYSGQADLGAALAAAGATQDEVRALVAALEACAGPRLPEGDPS